MIPCSPHKQHLHLKKFDVSWKKKLYVKSKHKIRWQRKAAPSSGKRNLGEKLRQYRHTKSRKPVQQVCSCNTFQFVTFQRGQAISAKFFKGAGSSSTRCNKPRQADRRRDCTLFLQERPDRMNASES